MRLIGLLRKLQATGVFLRMNPVGLRGVLFTDFFSSNLEKDDKRNAGKSRVRHTLGSKFSLHGESRDHIVSRNCIVLLLESRLILPYAPAEILDLTV